MTVSSNFSNQSETLLQTYRSVRQQSISICTPLQPEDYVVQPTEDVSPPKWHLGHATWFFENFILADFLPEYQVYDKRLNYFFNSYYESQGPRILRSNRGNMSRPSLQAILAYRAHVDQNMESLITQQQELDPKLYTLIIVGLQHEQQHQELLLTDIKYILGNNPIFPVYKNKKVPPVTSETMPPKWISFAEGVFEIGYHGTAFSWDNELPRHKTYIHPFSIQDRLVTNEEYLAFIESGGYAQFEHWLSDGWAWVKEQPQHCPLYWYQKEGQWYEYTLNGLLPLNLAAPVTHVNYYEADAYARWAGCRLPTEQEWEVACEKMYSKIPKDGNFVESEHYHPQPQTDKNDLQMLGHVWEWTGSAYLPYPNYPRFKGALGEYNGKFMVDQMVLRGGSCVTPHNHMRITYRNFFQSDKRWQFTGIRLAK